MQTQTCLLVTASTRDRCFFPPPCNSCSYHSHISLAAATISKQERSVERLAASFFLSLFLSFFLFFFFDTFNLPIRAVNPAICCDWLCSVWLSGWRLSLCGTSNHSPLCQTRWILFMVSYLCVSFCKYVCACVCVFPWYCIYTQTVYTTHRPHIDHPLKFNKFMSQRNPLCGKTKFCFDDWFCLLYTDSSYNAHTCINTHVHEGGGERLSCTHRRCFIASASVSFRCWHVVINYA